MAYVPPALRRKQNAALQNKDRKKRGFVDLSTSSDQRSLKDIQKHFWPTWVPDVVLKTSNSTDGFADGDNASRKTEPSHEQPDTKVATAGSQKSRDELNSDHLGMKAIDTELQSTKSTQPVHENETITDSNTPHTILRGDLLPNKRNGQIDERYLDSPDPDYPDDESVHPHNTLNSTEDSPDNLQYILLFHDANPRWRSDHTIYVKSALKLLPEANQRDPASGEPLRSQVMVFEQQDGRKSISTSMFVFIGYFKLVKMQILEPHSRELVQMQERKWTRTDRFGRLRQINRDAEGWKKSLNQRWAVLAFEEDTESTKKLDPPKIAALGNDANRKGMGKDRKSVNELLKEMRLKDGT